MSCRARDVYFQLISFQVKFYKMLHCEKIRAKLKGRTTEKVDREKCHAPWQDSNPRPFLCEAMLQLRHKTSSFEITKAMPN